MNLLLLSNSTNPGGTYLGHAGAWLREALGGVRRVLFVPYAGVTVSWDAYAAKVRGAFEPLGVAVQSIHDAPDAVAAVEAAEAIAVGGGNTFHLLRTLYGEGLIEPIRARAQAGVPYIGWSAGSNVAGPTIRTTNDMPIVEPPTLDALGLVPFQINPHYTDAHPPGFGGETRAERLAEFCAANPGVLVAGLPEGTALRVAGETVVERLGPHPVRVFEGGREPREMSEADLGFLRVSGSW